MFGTGTIRHATEQEKEEVSHHAHEEEEGELFAKLRHSMSEDDRAALGNEVLVMFEALLKKEPRFDIPAETTEAAPLPATET